MLFLFDIISKQSNSDEKLRLIKCKHSLNKYFPVKTIKIQINLDIFRQIKLLHLNLDPFRLFLCGDLLICQAALA